MQKQNLFPWHTIVDWYHKKGRHSLPWRDYHREQNDLLYRVWISEILLQQTQAERVIPFFEKILQKFPNIESLTNTDYDTFFPYYQGMGYYSRARNILKTATIITQNFEKIFPKNKKELTSLPWIGDYTSSAILAFGYGEPFLTWDTNLDKIFSRFLFGTSLTKLDKNQKEEIEQDFHNFIKNFEKSKQADIVRAVNNGLMDFARIIDDKNPNNIDWENYPLQCGKFYETRGSLEIFETKNKETFPIPDARIIAILHENHKKYFWLYPNKYSPFLLPPAENRDIRNFVKEFFREKYNLEVSVRPIHKKWLSQKWEPFVAVNVQIQTWKHDFIEFEKKFAKNILEEIYEN